MNWSEIPWRPTARTLRQFAALWLVFAGLLGWRVGGAPLAALAVAVGVAGLLRPALVRPLFVGLMVVTAPVGWLVSRLLLALLFYGLFTPVGVLFRLLGRDALELRRPDRPSYWAPKATPSDPRRYLQPF
jgi:hypothetical protein